MHWVYLSPHFDDVALSCGGLVWEQFQAYEPTSIWTICAGLPPEGNLSPFAQALHTRWGTGLYAPAQRKAEDVKSCQRLGAQPYNFSIPDCIYRRDPQSGEYMYASEEALTGALHAGDSEAIRILRVDLSWQLPPDATLVCPLSLGNHIDHQLTRRAAEGLSSPLWYYPDYPYALHCQAELEQMMNAGWRYKTFPISAGGLAAWQEAIAAHASQISTFWADEPAMRLSIEGYLRMNNGIRLWQPFAG